MRRAIGSPTFPRASAPASRDFLRTGHARRAPLGRPSTIAAVLFLPRGRARSADAARVLPHATSAPSRPRGSASSTRPKRWRPRPYPRSGRQEACAARGTSSPGGPPPSGQTITPTTGSTIRRLASRTFLPLSTIVRQFRCLQTPAARGTSSKITLDPYPYDPEAGAQQSIETWVLSSGK